MEETKTELQLIKMSEIQSQEVSWLCFPFIPYEKLTIVQGDPGDIQANAVYKIGNTALVNTEIFEKYLEQFIEPSVELIKHTWENLKETPNSGAE